MLSRSRALLKVARALLPGERRSCAVLHSQQGRSSSVAAFARPSAPAEASPERFWANERAFSWVENAEGPPQAHDPATSYRRQIYVTYHDLEEAVHRRGSSVYGLIAGTLLAAASIAALSWNRIKHWGAQEGAELASITLGDERLKMKAEDLAKSIANALLSDSETSGTARDFASRVASADGSMDGTRNFAMDVCQELVNDKALLQETQSFFTNVIRREPVWASAQELGGHVVSDAEFNDKGLTTLKTVLRSPEFKQAGFEYISEALSETKKDPATREEAAKACERVMEDPMFREHAREVVWSATKVGVLGFKGRSRVNREPYAANSLHA